MQGDAALREEREVVVERIVEESGGEKSASGGDEGRGGARGLLPGDEPAGEYAGGRDIDLDGRIGVDVDVESEVFTAEEAFPERREEEIGVCQEEERDFRVRVRRGQARNDDTSVMAAAGVVEGGDGGATEESEVVELVGEGDEGGGVVFGRQETRGEEEDERERKQHAQGCKHLL